MSLDLSTVAHHPAISEIVDVLCAKTNQQDRGFFQVEVAYFLGKMAATMRASIVAQDRGELPVNVYALALAPSGFGKGHSVTIVEQQLQKGFKTRFMEDTLPVLAEQNLWVIANNRAARNSSDQQEEYDFALKEYRSHGAYAFTFDSGTTPAVKQMRQKLLLASAGAINLQIDEIGSNLLKETEVLTTFLELYDTGSVKQKLVKNTVDNKRGEELDGMTPANMLLFGTPSKLFDGGATENEFYSLLETGYARRCLFGMGTKSQEDSGLTAEEKYRLRINPANNAAVTKWAQEFYKLADPAMFDWKLQVPDEVGIALIQYHDDCLKAAMALGEHEEIRKAELEHRHSKALKLAGALAFVDSSTHIELDAHLLPAIKLVEESGDAFQAILTREKTYVKLAKFIAQIGTEVTHADLHEALPFYKSSQAARNEMMTLATAWGYKKHIIIKKAFVDGIEFFKGETLKETDLSKIIVSYSSHWAYNYLAEQVPFDQLPVLTQAEGMHWANHHFLKGHRAEENTIAGFNMVTIDVDGGASLNTVHELLKDYKFLTYTTKSHQKEGKGDRFRLMLPTNYQLSLDQDEYKEFMNGILTWLPFDSDDASNQRSKKWESFAGGTFHLNNGEGTQLLDVLDFIPKTSRNEQHKQQTQELGSLDSLERWFASRLVTGSRNKEMIKYALCLVDAGWDLPSVQAQVHAFNKKLSDPMTPQEIDSTILVTVAKRYQQEA